MGNLTRILIKGLLALIVGLAVFGGGYYTATTRQPSIGTNPVTTGDDMLDGEKNSASQSMSGQDQATSTGTLMAPVTDESLREREAALQLLERQIVRERQDLESIRSEIEAKLLNLEAKRNELKTTYEGLKGDKLKTLKKMAPLYVGMKPEAAAKAMSGLETLEAIELLKLLDEKKAAKVLEAMALSIDTEQKAVEITQAMFRVDPDVPTNPSQ